MSTPSPLFNVVTTRESVHGAYFDIEKGRGGGGGCGYRQKRLFFLKLRKDADRKRLFYSNMPTLLSLIVAFKRMSREIVISIFLWRTFTLLCDQLIVQSTNYNKFILGEKTRAHIPWPKLE